jgi:protein-tyrosine phosphatase
MHALRQLAKYLLRTPQRLLHPYRRQKAEAMLRSAPVHSVLVLCLGNICRSPYAAAQLRAVLGAQWTGRVDSAGFIGPGRPSPWEAVNVATEHGIDLRDHRSRTVVAEDITQFDLIVVMEAGQHQRLNETFSARAPRVLVLGDLDPEPIAQRTIIDPFGRGLGEFHSSYARIDRCTARLAAAISAPRSTAPHPAR